MRMLYTRFNFIMFLTFMIYNAQMLAFIHQKLGVQELQEEES